MWRIIVTVFLIGMIVCFVYQMRFENFQEEFYKNKLLNSESGETMKKGTDSISEQFPNINDQVNYMNTLRLFYRYQQLGDFINGKFNKLLFQSETAENHSNAILRVKNDITNFYNIIISDLLLVTQLETQTHWVKIKLSKLTKTIQNRIHTSQFPMDCSKVKKLDCRVHGECGIGCQLHYIVYCLILGYSTNRVVLPVLETWNFSENLTYNLSWNDLFLPITNCTANKNGDDILSTNLYHVTADTVPPAIPEEFAEYLQLHPNPALFWISQFVNFTMRYSSKFLVDIERSSKYLNFNNPTVGVHIRRTDKVGVESNAFEIEEYMAHVDKWYDVHDCRTCNGSKKRRVYLVTDEPKVLNETLLKYPEYEFVYDYEISVKAKSSRYQPSNLINLITSIHLLSRCDYIVCTFSSNICRLAYELMQIIKNGDLTESVKSLDANYFFYGQKCWQQVAISDHKPDSSDVGDIELKVGDILLVQQDYFMVRNKFDGHRKGRNVRTNAYGRYPLYKVENKIVIMKIPESL